jgi:hypothetical protein
MCLLSFNAFLFLNKSNQGIIFSESFGYFYYITSDFKPEAKKDLIKLAEERCNTMGIA